MHRNTQSSWSDLDAEASAPGTESDLELDLSDTSGEEDDAQKTRVLRHTHYCNSAVGQRVMGCEKEESNIRISSRGIETTSRRCKFEKIETDRSGGIECQTSFVKTLEKTVVKNAPGRSSRLSEVETRSEESLDVEHKLQQPVTELSDASIIILEDQHSETPSLVQPQNLQDRPISPPTETANLFFDTSVSAIDEVINSLMPSDTSVRDKVTHRPQVLRLGHTALTYSIEEQSSQELDSTSRGTNKISHVSSSSAVAEISCSRNGKLKENDNYSHVSADDNREDAPAVSSFTAGPSIEISENGIHHTEDLGGATASAFIQKESELCAGLNAAVPKFSIKSVSFANLQPSCEPSIHLLRTNNLDKDGSDSTLSTFPSTSAAAKARRDQRAILKEQKIALDNALKINPFYSQIISRESLDEALCKLTFEQPTREATQDINLERHDSENEHVVSTQFLAQRKYGVTCVDQVALESSLLESRHGSTQEFACNAEKREDAKVKCLNSHQKSIMNSGEHEASSSSRQTPVLSAFSQSPDAIKDWQDSNGKDETRQVPRLNSSPSRESPSYKDATEFINLKKLVGVPGTYSDDYRISAKNYYIRHKMILLDLDSPGSVHSSLGNDVIEEGVTSFPSVKRDLALLSLKDQELIMLNEVCLLLGAYDGFHVRFNADRSDGAKYQNRFGEFSIDEQIAPPLKAIVVSLLPLISCHGYLIIFFNVHLNIQSQSMLQSFVGLLGVFLAKYHQFVSKARADVDNIYALYDRLHPQTEPFKVWAHTAADIAIYKLRGGALLDYILKGTHQIVKDITSCLANQFMQILKSWLQHGVIRDPYGEFFIVDLDSLGENLVSMGCTTEYWNNRFVLKTELLPTFLNNEVDHIVTAGKFVKIVQQCSRKVFRIQKLNLVITERCQNIAPELEKAYHAAARNFYDVLVNEHDLLGHFDFIQEFLLEQNNGVISTFLDVARGTLKEPLPCERESQFHTILWRILKQSAHKDNPKISFLRCLLVPPTIKDQFAALVSGELQSSAKCNHCFESFALSYEAPWPISLVVNKNVTIKLQMLWRHIFQISFIEVELGRICGQDEPVLKDFYGCCENHQRIFSLRQRMRRLLQNLKCYMTSKVIGREWNAFIKEVQTVLRADKLFELMQNFLNTALYNCMIVGNDALCDSLCKLRALCMEFVQYKDGNEFFAAAENYLSNFNQLEAALLDILHKAVRDSPHSYFQLFIDMNSSMKADPPQQEKN